MRWLGESVNEKAAKSTKKRGYLYDERGHEGSHSLHVQCINTRNLAAVDEIFASDFYSHPLKTGIEGVKKSYAARFQAFPDIRVAVEELLVDGEKVASRTSIHGVPAMADGTQPMIIEIIRVQNQRIAEVWALTNMG